MPRPDVRIACCLCAEPIARTSDIYALDEEWQRRFPTMVGILACDTCAVSSHTWSCRGPGGEFVAGHHSAARKADCYDSGDHIDGWGTHVAMVGNHPWSGLQQGAEEYLRHLLHRPGIDNDVAWRIQDAFHRRDTQERIDPGR